MTGYIERDELYLINRVELDELTGCWLWVKTLNINGYGVYSDPRPKMHYVSAHRRSYELFIGDLDSNLTIDHLCSVRRCINPDHLEQVTARENLMRSSNHVSLKAKQTECIRGHELSWMGRQNRRFCRTCQKQRSKKYLEKIRKEVENGKKKN